MEIKRFWFMKQLPNEARHRIAALLQFGIDVKGPVWAAARDGQR
jgi:hypothetical protein